MNEEELEFEVEKIENLIDEKKFNDLRQYLEELFGAEICTPAHTEEASFGAAIFASVATGVYSSTFDAAKQMIYYQ